MVVSAAGHTASSIDLHNWQQQALFAGYFSALSVAAANDIFILSGRQKYIINSGPYLAGSEIAQILISQNGAWPWTMVWSSCYDSSIIYQIRYFAHDNRWIAVGQQLNRPLLVHSIDNGTTWDDVAMPSEFIGQRFYDVTYVNGNYYFSANGSVIHNTSNFAIDTWAEGPLLAVDNTASILLGISSNPLGHLVAVGSQSIWYSLDRVNWYLSKTSGYDPRCVIWYNNTWFVSGDTLLTQYTYWVSRDSITWTPNNNGIDALALLAIP